MPLLTGVGIRLNILSTENGITRRKATMAHRAQVIHLGAFFMATDYATTPVTTKGKIIFGIGCGLITFIIRQFSSSYTEGVSFAILLMNILTPYIDMITRPKALGAIKAKKKEA